VTNALAFYGTELTTGLKKLWYWSQSMIRLGLSPLSTSGSDHDNFLTKLNETKLFCWTKIFDEPDPVNSTKINCHSQTLNIKLKWCSDSWPNAKLPNDSRPKKARGTPGNPYWRGRLSTVDLLIKAACFVTKENRIFSTKTSWSKLVGTRRSTILNPPLQYGFPGQT
jgi:hypothetical protein